MAALFMSSEGCPSSTAENPVDSRSARLVSARGWWTSHMIRCSSRVVYIASRVFNFYNHMETAWQGQIMTRVLNITVQH